MSDNATTIQVLNELLAAQKRSLLLRLTETAPFVASTDAELGQVVRRMIREEGEHIDWLVEAIVEHRGTPVSPVPDPRTGSVHYIDLRYLLPRIVQDERRVLRACESAAERVAEGPAVRLIARIADRHQRHLEELGAMAGASA